MKINTAKMFTIDALKSLKRNKTITIATIATVMVTLLIFGVFVLVGMNVSETVKDIEGKTEVQVYLKEDITQEQMDEIKAQASSKKGVKDVQYVDKDTAWTDFSKQFDNYQDILKGYEGEKNPLSDSYIVKLEGAEYADKIETEVKELPGVDSIRNDKDTLKKIESFAATVKWIGIIIFVVLAAVSIFLIMNTIKLTVYSRRKEVGIMKFVGATDWFIRWPFMIEGIIIGIIGSILSNISLFFIYKAVSTSITSAMFMSATLVPAGVVLYGLIWPFILAGTVLGAVASFIALRRFLIV